MKIISSLFFILILSFTSKGQGNLQFNNAKFIKFGYNFILSGQPFDTVLVVPTGKTWKIESAGAFMKNGPLTYPAFGAVFLDGIPIGYSVAVNATQSEGGTMAAPSLPIWLPSGSYTLRLQPFINNYPGSRFIVGFLSGIEFNIVQ